MQSQIFFSVQMLLLMFKNCNYPYFVIVVLMINKVGVSPPYTSLHFSESVFCIITQGASAGGDCKKMVKEGWGSFSFLHYSVARGKFKEYYSTSPKYIVSLLHKEKYPVHRGPRLKASVHSAWIYKRLNALCEVMSIFQGIENKGSIRGCSAFMS